MEDGSQGERRERQETVTDHAGGGDTEGKKVVVSGEMGAARTVICDM